jgi:hypothetical protein
MCKRNAQSGSHLRHDQIHTQSQSQKAGAQMYDLLPHQLTNDSSWHV